MEKKAQVNAAVLVAIIAGLIILYVLFLPAEETEKFLEEDFQEDENDEGDDEEEERVLLEESPGTLPYIKENEMEHIIPPMNLFISTSSEVIKDVNAIYIKNGMFDKKSKIVQFAVPDNSENLILSFDVAQSEGMLEVKLNGYELFNGQVSGNIDPISLPKAALREDNNIKLSVSDVGFMFWKTNEYTIENLKIIGDVTDTSSRKGTGSFFLEGSEADNIKSAKLKFFPDCEVRRVARLDILINNYDILSSIPDCGMLQTVEFSPFILVEGENRIEFRTDKGQYLIDRIVVKTELKDTPSYVQYFELDAGDIENIEDDDLDVNMTLVFIDDETEKEADIIINGRKTTMPLTEEIAYSRNIDPYVEEGTNAIKILPKKTLEIREMKIELIET